MQQTNESKEQVNQNDWIVSTPDGVENIIPVKINICSHHNKVEWIKGEYIDNKDGTVSCRNCPWGTKLPGYMRCIDGKIINLRSL